MYKTAIAAAVGLTGGWIGFHYLTTVNHPDIYAYNGLNRSVLAVPLRPGNIVAMSEDMLRMEKICDLNLPDDRVEEVPVSDIYYNNLKQSLPDFAEAVGWSVELVLPDKKETKALGGAGGGIQFTGKLSTMREVTSATGMTETCECEMARRLNARQRVCTVNTSMVEFTRVPSGEMTPGGDRAMTERQRTVAVTLARSSNFVREPVFAACNLEMSDAARHTMVLPCDAGTTLPADTRIRQWLNIIDKKPMAEQTAGLAH